MKNVNVKAGDKLIMDCMFGKVECEVIEATSKCNGGATDIRVRYKNQVTFSQLLKNENIVFA